MSKKGTKSKTFAAPSPPTIADLAPEEKEKVERLVQRLVSLGREHDALSDEHAQMQQELTNERSHNAEMNLRQEAELAACRNHAKEEVEAGENKVRYAMSLVRLYQNKLSHLLEMNRSSSKNASNAEAKLIRMEGNIKQMELLLETQRSTVSKIHSFYFFTQFS